MEINVQELLRNAVLGWQRINGQGKYIVLFLGVLLAAGYFNCIKKKQMQQNDQGKLLFCYSCLTAVLAIVPITAVALMLYQTKFYDYEWIWSVVPLTAVIAAGAACLVDSAPWQIDQKCENGKAGIFGKGKTVVFVLIMLGVLFLCGNRGSDSAWNRGADLFGGDYLKESEEQARLILDKLAEIADTDDTEDISQAAEAQTAGMFQDLMLWAPADILGSVRGIDGSVRVLYGRNMWEEALNAYSYDQYDEETITLYEWMEEVKHTKTQLQEQLTDVQVFEMALQKGVNCIVLPINRTHTEAHLREAAEQSGYKIRPLFTEEYYIYRIFK